MSVSVSLYFKNFKHTSSLKENFALNTYKQYNSYLNGQWFGHLIMKIFCMWIFNTRKIIKQIVSGNNNGLLGKHRCKNIICYFNYVFPDL